MEACNTKENTATLIIKSTKVLNRLVLVTEIKV